MESERENRKRAGRPAKTVRKEVRASIRFTKAEYSIIEQKATTAGVKASAYLREIAINSAVKTRLTEEERQFVRQLIGMANNLNQLAKMSHQEGLLKVMHYLQTNLTEIDTLIKQLKNAQ